MKTTEKTLNILGNSIDENELPVSARLKVIRTNNPNYGLTEDEIQDRNEFIFCYLMKDYSLFRMIPKQEKENDFFIADFDVNDSEYSAFNSIDFQRMLKPFDKYGYAMKKIMERVKDLALLYSVISATEGRKNTYQRFESLLEIEFRSRLMSLIKRYNETASHEKKFLLKGRIGELNRRIIEAKKIWEQHAPRDT